MIKKKLEDILGEDHFGFRRGKGTKDAVGMLRIISEQTWDIDQKLCVCFTDMRKARDRVHVTESIQILERTFNDWRERKLISKLHMDQTVELKNCTRGRQEVWRLEEGLDKDAVFTYSIQLVQQMLYKGSP